jgi:hypothetical protein
MLYFHKPVATQSKVWTVFVRSYNGIMGLNLTQAMDMDGCLCVGGGLETGWSSLQVVLLIVYKIKELKEQPRPNKGL